MYGRKGSNIKDYACKYFKLCFSYPKLYKSITSAFEPRPCCLLFYKTERVTTYIKNFTDV